MKNLDALSNILKQLAPNNVLGDAHGIPAAAYIRVSSEEQAKEGRDGLPRQIQHISEIAAQKGYRIDLADIYADDDSGFEYEYRFALNRLRRDYLQGRFSAVVMEHLDRLSRTGWHQGLLLHEMKKAKLAPVFWKEFSSEIERAVMGAISEQGMQQAKERMTQGMKSKALSGRVTSKNAAFGYRFVDKDGRESPDSRRHTYYGICEAEAVIVRTIFTKCAYEEMSLRKLAEYVRTVDTSRWWGPNAIQRILTSRLYKGEYVHGRMEVVKTPKYDREGNFIGMRIAHTERSEDEWVIVPVPAIVSTQLWEDAQRALKQNKKTSTRNSKREYLLTGLTKCAHCGKAYVVSGGGNGTNWKGGDRENMIYGCSKTAIRTEKCIQKGIVVHRLETAVWEAVLSILLDPTLVLESLERKLNGERNTMLLTEIQYLQSKLEEIPTREKRLRAAYDADAFTPQEFADERNALKTQRLELETQLQVLQGKLVTPEQVETQKQFLLAICEKARGMDLDSIVPFEAKRRIIRLMVDRIVVDTVNNWFSIEGVIGMEFSLDYVRSCPQNRTQITYRSLYTLSGTFLEMEL